MTQNRNASFARSISRELDILLFLAGLDNNVYTTKLKDADVEFSSDGSTILKVYLITDFYE